MHGAFGQRLPWEATLSSLMFGDYNTHSFWSLTSLHVSMGFLGLWRYNTYMVLGWNHQDLDVLKMLVGKKQIYYSQTVVKNGEETISQMVGLIVISDCWQKEKKSPLTKPRIQVICFPRCGRFFFRKVDQVPCDFFPGKTWPVHWRFYPVGKVF